MKLFLKKFFLFVAIWLAIFSLLYITAPKKFYYKSDYGLFSGISDKIKSNGLHGNVVIGDSRSLVGVKANILHALNLSLGGECTIEGYYEVREILQNKTNHIDTLFLSYSMQHLLTQECLYWNSYYYGIIDSKYLDSVRAQAAAFNDTAYFYKADHGLFSKFKKLNTPTINQEREHIKEFVLEGFNSAYQYVVNNAQGKIPSAANQLKNGRIVSPLTDTMRYNRLNGGFFFDDKHFPAVQAQVNKIYLSKIVQLCKDHHVTLVFITMPMLQSTQPGNIHEDVIDNLHQLFGNQIIQDTSAYADEYFRDGKSHLNIYGINRFSRFLQQRLYGSTTNQTAMR